MIRSFYNGLLKPSGEGSKRYKLLVRACVSIGVLVFLLWWLPTDVLFGAITRISWTVWGLVVSGFLLGHLLSSLKWRLLLHVVGVKISVTEAIRAHAAGLFANLCLPSVVGGDVVRAAVVVRDHKRVEGIALGSLADRINDSFALLLLAALAGIFIPNITEIAIGQILVGAAILLLSTVIVIFTLIRWFPVTRLPYKIGQFVLRIRDAQNSLIRSPGTAFTAFMMSFAIQGGFILLNVVLADEIGIAAPLSLWFFAWPMAKLIALAPISLGGIGVREVAIAGLMAPFGINSTLVIAQSLSWEVVLVGSGLFAGLIATVLPGYKRSMK
jgi:uncharacterized protein (TIRG00374 family)